MTPEERAEAVFKRTASMSLTTKREIAQAIREAVAEERERCAGIATDYTVAPFDTTSCMVAKQIVHRIRSLPTSGEKP